jgi:integrase
LKDGTVYWQVGFREERADGTYQASLSWDTESDARRCDALIKQHGPAKAREILKIIEPGSQLTVTGWLTQHIDHLTGVEPGTIRRYKSYLANDIGPVLGDLPLEHLSRDDIARWMLGLKGKDGLPPSGKTIANKHGFLAGALNAAVIAGKLKTNPCDGNRLPRWDREEMVFLDRGEFRILLAAVTEHWRPLVEFLVASGCRWSKATALKAADINVAAATVRIRRAWKTGDGGYTLGVPKTKKSVRTINVPKRVLEQLDLTGEWVFTNSGRGRRNAGGPVRIHSFHPNVWVPAVARAQEAGLTKKPRIHDIRHTCASWLMQAGRPLPSVQQHLGHESIQTTSDVYGHLDRWSGRDNADAIDAMLG